ncbi:hypothetical protein B7494_g7179 [Chlorociboria aeruginascens]|nr:hypothetical protein B7494_g7179 [Chlorociboria aeruginascens]
MLGLQYWMVPIFSGCVWLAMLLGMLLWWAVEKHELHLTPMADDQYIAYISDIGAHELQPLFISLGTLAVVTFDAVFIAERWLRHLHRLPANTTNLERWLWVLSSIFALVGAIGLIILTCANDVDHLQTHDVCLAIFIAGYIISAIFICWEYQRLEVQYRQYRVLLISFWIKFIFIVVEAGLAIAFGVLNDRSMWNAGAIVEWTIAFIFTFYVWSFAIDFIPAVRHGQFVSEETVLDMAEEGQNRMGNGVQDGRITNF